MKFKSCFKGQLCSHQPTGITLKNTEQKFFLLSENSREKIVLTRITILCTLVDFFFFLFFFKSSHTTVCSITTGFPDTWCTAVPNCRGLSTLEQTHLGKKICSGNFIFFLSAYLKISLKEIMWLINTSGFRIQDVSAVHFWITGFMILGTPFTLWFKWTVTSRKSSWCGTNLVYFHKKAGVCVCVHIQVCSYGL